MLMILAIAPVFIMKNGLSLSIKTLPYETPELGDKHTLILPSSFIFMVLNPVLVDAVHSPTYAAAGSACTCFS